MNLEIFLKHFDNHFFFSLFTQLYNQTVRLPTPYRLHFQTPYLTSPPSQLKHKDEMPHHFSFRSCKFSLSQNSNKYKCNAPHYKPCIFFLKGSKMSFFTSFRVEEKILCFLLKRVKRERHINIQ